MICGPGNDFGLKKGSKIIQGKKFYPVKLMVQKVFGLKKCSQLKKILLNQPPEEIYFWAPMVTMLLSYLIQTLLEPGLYKQPALKPTAT